jgi:Ethanolamine utilization protein EutJ (predicted chaperonin)
MADITTFNKDTPLQLDQDKLRFNILSKYVAVNQTAKTRLQSFKTEFFLNVNYGVDWYGVVLNQGAQPVEQEAELNDVLRDTTGVTSLQASEILRNATERESVYLARIVADGQITDLDLPFSFLEP